jgi:hypothetical protein
MSLPGMVDRIYDTPPVNFLARGRFGRLPFSRAASALASDVTLPPLRPILAR